ncbi:CCHC-type domain-containing protein [Trichonephila clavipes]|nr:CCHC-type domain-containing protein [Trichonephila clavipes]
MPAIINNDTEIQVLCDPCEDITVGQQSCVPNDNVIHPLTEGQFQVVDHEIKPIALPFKRILGFDWQQNVRDRCTYDPSGSLCISTPTSFHVYEFIHASKPSTNCVAFHQPSQPSLYEITLEETTPNAVSSEAKLIPKFRRILYNTISTLCTPDFIVEQLFHGNTPRRVVVGFSHTINPITKIDPHPIDQMEDVIERTAGKRYNSKMYVKSTFNCTSIRETDIYKKLDLLPMMDIMDFFECLLVSQMTHLQ